MKFAVGYQQPQNGESFSAIVIDYRSKINEVYFSWFGNASGRPVLGGDLNSQHILEEELKILRASGIKLDLLFNANCYGARAVSRSLEDETRSIIEHLGGIGCFPEIVTTTSPMIARSIKKYFPEIEVRASVNMRIGTIQAMTYVADLFDSFYIQRDLQRNLDYVKKVSDWCKSNNKKICLLANSGCLRFCPGQTFHDNLIAHSEEAEKLDNVSDWNPHLCWNLYSAPQNYVEILKSTWIRPEDIFRYEALVDTVKLATRQHSHPYMVIGAYTDRHFTGNLLDLFEPGFSSLFAPCFIDNTAFPLDWAERISTCSNECDNCSYCRQVFNKVLKSFC